MAIRRAHTFIYRPKKQEYSGDIADLSGIYYGKTACNSIFNSHSHNGYSTFGMDGTGWF